jgi:DNA-binding MarR family transcriptional regulator
VSRKDRDALLEELTEQFRAYQTATDRLDELAQRIMGINRTDGRCLDILDRAGRITAGRLAAESGLTTGAVTAVVDRLERAGYVRRVPDPTDRRKVLVEVTEKAEEAAAEIYGGMAAHGRRLLERFSDEQIELFIELMRGARELTTGNTEALLERLEASVKPQAARTRRRSAAR